MSRNCVYAKKYETDATDAIWYLYYKEAIGRGYDHPIWFAHSQTIRILFIPEISRRILEILYGPKSLTWNPPEVDIGIPIGKKPNRLPFERIVLRNSEKRFKFE